MDIYVLHDGQELGPLPVERTRLLLTQGSILADDLAWTPGMEKWEPLATVLPPDAPADFPPPLEVPDESAHASMPVAAPVTPPSAPAEDRMPLEIATPKQRALLAFLHIPFNLSTSKQEAALLISDAMENPAYTVRLGQWPRERLKLHGDLFITELQARKENRIDQYMALVQTEGAALFTGINRTHIQGVLTLLDLEEPEWEANDDDAIREHFFPALAAKFPQLVREESRRRLSRAGAKRSQRLEGASGGRQRPGPNWTNHLRNAFFVALAGGIGWFGYRVFRAPASPAPALPAMVAPASTPAPAAPAPAELPPPTVTPGAAPAMMQ